MMPRLTSACGSPHMRTRSAILRRNTVVSVSARVERSYTEGAPVSTWCPSSCPGPSLPSSVYSPPGLICDSTSVPSATTYSASQRSPCLVTWSALVMYSGSRLADTATCSCCVSSLSIGAASSTSANFSRTCSASLSMTPITLECDCRVSISSLVGPTATTVAARRMSYTIAISPKMAPFFSSPMYRGSSSPSCFFHTARLPRCTIIMKSPLSPCRTTTSPSAYSLGCSLPVSSLSCASVPKLMNATCLRNMRLNTSWCSVNSLVLSAVARTLARRFSPYIRLSSPKMALPEVSLALRVLTTV
mmetsp:Transcript_13908/g.47958  ORF Transcript_13908/g.47958 Transcript_13908/m.47958 type:complete len:303 (-) Transcript_13908:641-1549(-)